MRHAILEERVSRHKTFMSILLIEKISPIFVSNKSSLFKLISSTTVCKFPFVLVARTKLKKETITTKLLYGFWFHAFQNLYDFICIIFIQKNIDLPIDNNMKYVSSGCKPDNQLTELFKSSTCH